jgi:hypothetical protein
VGYDELVFIALSLLVVILAAAVARRVAPWLPAQLLVAAVVLRVVGSTARHEVIFRFYNGLGDAVRYFEEGLVISGWIRSFQLNPLSPGFWFSGTRWWGTQFLIKTSGVVVTFLGPSLRGEFLVYALASFGGLFAIAVAIRRTQPRPESHLRFAAWLWLWPSLWFWPASVGKEAILMLAIGLATLGYTGDGKGIRWLTFLAGVGLAFCLRPHVAAVIAFSALVAYWLGTWERVTVRRIFETVAALALTIVALMGMREQLGLADADLEGMREFVQYRAAQTLQGGSNIGAPTLGPAALPVAFINVWMRPFPWDVHNATSAFAAIEILAFWGLAWHRRRAVRLALARWRQHRLLRFGLPMVVVYTVMIGITFGNLGIIARQRVLVLPFMILLLAAAPDPRAEAVPRRPAPMRRPAVTP